MSERVEAILEILAQQTLATARNTEAIAELREVVEQQNRTIAYDPSHGWSSGSLV